MDLKAKKDILAIIIDATEEEEKIDRMIGVGLEKKTLAERTIRTSIPAKPRKSPNREPIKHCGRTFADVNKAVRACYPKASPEELKPIADRIRYERRKNNTDPSDLLPPLGEPKKKLLGTDRFGNVKVSEVERD